VSRVLVSCGEASGDLYAGALVNELRRLDPDLRACGFGGPALEAAGAALVGDYRGTSVTGLVEVLRVLPRTWRMLRRLVAAADRERPDVFVAVDFPDFNFRLGRALKRRGIPVVYYISPQLWAWRSGRLATLETFVDRMLVIFPFERALYERAGIPVDFVGHPLVDLIDTSATREALLCALGLPAAAPTVALLPGSRPNEVRRLLPVLLEAAGTIAAQQPGVQFVVARAPRLDDGLFAAIAAARTAGVPIAAAEGVADAVLRSADVVVTASGTATVQAALHDRPMVIVYRLSPLTYRFGVRFVKVDTYGMVNLVAGRRIVPELIQDECTAPAIARETLRYLREPGHARATRAALADVRARLGGPGATARAAQAVLDVAHQAKRGKLKAES
jgi:lipid-A-disaccharide synthase